MSDEKLLLKWRDFHDNAEKALKNQEKVKIFFILLFCGKIMKFKIIDLFCQQGEISFKGSWENLLILNHYYILRGLLNVILKQFWSFFTRVRSVLRKACG